MRPLLQPSLGGGKEAQMGCRKVNVKRCAIAWTADGRTRADRVLRIHP